MGYRNRTNDGVGRGINSDHKHNLFKQVASAQIVILNLKIKGQGLIVDMHAGDGNGIEKHQLVLPFLEKEFHEYMLSEPSPRLADKWARQCTPIAEVILCEKQADHRAHLEHFFASHTHVRIYPNHNLLEKEDLSRYAWIFVFNDPNGPAWHGITVLDHIAQHPKADFLIVVNELAIQRHSALSPQGPVGESPRIQGARATSQRDVWMLDPENWQRRLNRQWVAWHRTTINNPAFHGRVIVASNYLNEHLHKSGWITKEITNHA